MKTKEELLSFAMSRADVDGDLYEKDAEIIEYLLNNMPFTIPEGNAATVLGEEYAQNIKGDVQVKIVDDGAVVTTVDLTYTLAGDGANLADSVMTVKVVYTYDLERITIV